MNELHDPDSDIHLTLLRLVHEQFQANDYRLEIAGSKKKDFYAKALLHVGSGDGRKAYFKVDGRQRVPAIVMLNSHLLAKWEITVGQKYRVYVPGGGQVATLRAENG